MNNGSIPGGGFFGDRVRAMNWSFAKFGWILFELVIQIFYAWWNYSCLFHPLMEHDPSLEADSLPNDEDAAMISLSEDNELT